jgi:hypothetical protein
MSSAISCSAKGGNNAGDRAALQQGNLGGVRHAAVYSELLFRYGAPATHLSTSPLPE